MADEDKYGEIVEWNEPDDCADECDCLLFWRSITIPVRLKPVVQKKSFFQWTKIKFFF